MSTPFEQAMQLMRRHDPQKQEDGFALMRAHAVEHLDELIAEFHREPNHGLRCWLLELIGHARSPRALPLLTDQLHNTDDALRQWAVTGLELLNTHKGPESTPPSPHQRSDRLTTNHQDLELSLPY